MPANRNSFPTVGSKWRSKRGHGGRPGVPVIVSHVEGGMVRARFEWNGKAALNSCRESFSWFLARYEPIDTDEDRALAAVVVGKVD